MRSIFIAAALIAVASPAAAEEVTLRAVSAFAEGTEFSRNFERFVEKVNADGKGLIKINYIGGGRAGGPLAGGNAVRPRGGGMGNVTEAFFPHPLPPPAGLQPNSQPMNQQSEERTR